MALYWRNVMKNYEGPELFELGEATVLTLGNCSCNPDDCDGRKPKEDDGEIGLM